MENYKNKMRLFKKVVGVLSVLFWLNSSLAQNTFYVTDRSLGSGSGTLNTALTYAVISANEGNAVTVYFNVPPDVNGRTFVVINQQLATVHPSAGTIVLTKDPSNNYEQGMEFSDQVNLQTIFRAGGARVHIKELGIRSISSVDKIHCPPLVNPISFYNNSATPCTNVSFQYSIASIAGATGYEWNYTGSGATIKLVSAPEADPMVSLSNTVNYTSTTGNDVYVKFNENCTDGLLKVRAYKFCSFSNQNVYTAELTMAIQHNQGAQFVVSPDNVFNCQQEAIQLSATCSVPNSTYNWNLIGNPDVHSSVGTLQTSINDQIGDDYVYTVSILYPLGGKTSCRFLDTVHIIKNVVKPTVSFNIEKGINLNCYSPTYYLNAGTDDGNELSWHLEYQNYADPVTINYSMVNSETYYVVATNPTNFCKDSIGVPITNDYTIPNIPYLNGELYTIGTPIGTGTVGCRASGLSVTAMNLDNENNTFDWVNTNLPNSYETNFNSNMLSDSLIVTGSNGCKLKFNVFADVDFTIPVIIPMPDQVVNCSYTMKDLVHPTNNCSESGWFYQPDNSFLSIDIYPNASEGTYIYAFIDSASGCPNYDTVVVTNSKIFEFLPYSLPRICENDSFVVDPLVLNGGTETVNYLWSDLSTNSTFEDLAVADEIVSLNVTTASGCHGDISIPVDVVQALSPLFEVVPICGGSANGLNVIPGYAEAPPLVFSFNGHPYNDQAYLQLDSIGMYTIEIKDENDCISFNTWQVLSIPLAPDPYFLMSSYNLPDAIVAVVNTSEFYYDSISWELPPNVYFSYETDSVRYLEATDTGYFNITMFAYIDSCVFEISKMVYFGNAIPLDFNVSEGKGILKTTMFPNPTIDMLRVGVAFGVAQYSFMYITNIQGNILLSSELNYGSSNGYTFHDLSQFPPGEYILHIVSDYDAYYKKFIIIN